MKTTRIEYDIDMHGNTVGTKVHVTYFDNEWPDFDDWIMNSSYYTVKYIASE